MEKPQQNELIEIIRERNTYFSERNKLIKERDIYKNERDQLIKERDIYKGERDQLLEERKINKTWAPSGHYYSPIPSIDDIRKRDVELFQTIPSKIDGIELNDENQLRLMDEFKHYYHEIPFTNEKTEGTRYFYNNDVYGHADAITLYSMIRHVKPNKIIEVGSGFSSAVMLDTNERFFNDSISCTFIEPYPERLLSLVREKDNVNLIKEKLEELDTSAFETLSENDILFIDSTHVSKVGSDVNFLFSNIIPKLKKGVYVHIHDIFYPFEYPKHWVYEGRAWNEAYVARAFLQYNNSFEIVYWNHFLSIFHSNEVLEKLPLCMTNTGASLWLKKIR